MVYFMINIYLSIICILFLIIILIILRYNSINIECKKLQYKEIEQNTLISLSKNENDILKNDICRLNEMIIDLKADNKSKSDKINDLYLNANNDSSSIDKISNKINNEIINKLGSIIQSTEKSMSEKINQFAVNAEKSDQDSKDRILNLKDEINKLTKLLSGNTKRIGTFGEDLLIRMLELFGLTRGQDFDVEKTFNNLKPDIVLYTAGDDKNKVFIDAKTICNIDSINYENPGQIINLYKKHIKDLYEKEYTKKIDGSFDIMIMFIPSDEILKILEKENFSILEEALGKNIAIATPSTIGMILNMLTLIKNKRLRDNNINQAVKIVEDIQKQARLISEDVKRLLQAWNKSNELANGISVRLNKLVMKPASSLQQLGISENQSKINELNNNILTIDSLACYSSEE